MRWLAILLVLLASPLQQVVKPQVPLGNRLLFVVDVSGSMSGDEFKRALSWIRTISEQPTDELEVSVITFADQYQVYPKGWVKLPDAKALEELHTWLSGQLVPGGDTKVIPALERALRVKRNALTVVLVTDGIFPEAKEGILSAVKRAQAKREQPATLAVLGVGGVERDVLRQLGKVGRGGYFQAKTD